MLKLAWLFIILSCYPVMAQELSRDQDFIETQNTVGMPFTLPIYMNMEGEINLIFRNSGFSSNPLGQVALNYSKSLYIKPQQKTAFTFSEQDSTLGWIEVKRTRWELGLGAAASLAQNFIAVGLAPYKGARQVMVRHKDTEDEATPLPRLPDSLDELKDWRVGDRGSFQRYGGVHIYAGAVFSAVNILTVGLTIQNLFSVGLEKIGPTEIKLSISEENLNKRRLQSGVALAHARLHFFNGKRLTTHFILNLENPEHADLYRLALKGKLSQLQGKLPQEAQLMEWDGSERLGYIGIPGLIGKHVLRSEYEMDFDGEVEIIDVKTHRNSGWFLPLRNHSHLVYQTEKEITLFWFSEMNRTDEGVFERKFLIPGRMMGAKGFDTVLPSGTNMGSTLSQMGMSFTRAELENVSPEMLEDILVHFKDRCEKMKLTCAKAKRFKKIAKALRGYLNKKWEDVRDKLGFLMLKEPALINSYIKAIKSDKKVYFKFLNQKYQSMEGAAPIEV